MKAYDKVLIFFTVVFLIIIGFTILSESPAQKACREYNRTLMEGNK